MTARRLLTNAIANALGFLAQFAVSFLLAPIVLRSLGEDRYGVWSFAESVLAYLMLFDLGIASALVRFVPRMMAVEDGAGVNRTFSACLAFFLAVAAVVGVCGGLLVSLCGDQFFRVPASQASEIRLVLLAVVANFAIVLPLSVFPAILDGLNAFSSKTIVRTAVLVARVPATLWVIRADRPLLGLILLLTASNLVESLLIAAVVIRRIPGLRFVPRQIDRATIRSIRSFSLDSFVAMIAGRLTFSTDSLVIGAILGWAAITPFTFANRLVDLARFLLRSTTVTLTPAISASEARGDMQAVRAYFLHGTRLALFAAMPVQAGLLILGKPFLAIWLRGMNVAEPAGPTLWVLAATLSLTIAQSVASRVLYGTGQIRLFARMALLEGVVNLVISFALVRPLGIVGVAWGTAIPHIGFCLYAVTHACRLAGVRPSDYLRQWLWPVLLSGLPATVWLICVAQRPLSGWANFFAVGFVGMIPYGVAVLGIEGRPWFGAALPRLRRILAGAFRHSAAR